MLDNGGAAAAEECHVGRPVRSQKANYTECRVMKLLWNHLWFFHRPTCPHQPRHHLMGPRPADHCWSSSFLLSLVPIVWKGLLVRYIKGKFAFMLTLRKSSVRPEVCLLLNQCQTRLIPTLWYSALMERIIKTISITKASFSYSIELLEFYIQPFLLFKERENHKTLAASPSARENSIKQKMKTKRKNSQQMNLQT